jgi:hypothetical protein
METCFDKLKNNYGAIPERILGKMTVAVRLVLFIHIFCSHLSVAIQVNIYLNFNIFQVVKALHYLKESHGVMHRGRLKFIPRSMSLLDVQLVYQLT